MLLKLIPDKVASVTTDPDNKGFTLLTLGDQYPKHQFVKHIAMLLGGFAAEEIVFGPDNVTTGPSADLLQATHLATGFVKQYGFGNIMAVAATPTPFTDGYVFDTDGKIDEQAVDLMEEAKVLAFNTLRRNYKFLLVLGEYLRNNSAMNKKLITNIATAILKILTPKITLRPKEYSIENYLIKNYLWYGRAKLKCSS